MKSKVYISLLCGLVLLSFIGADAFADSFFKSGNDLIPMMQGFENWNAGDKGPNRVKAMEYIAYITGVFDATRNEYEIPPSVKGGQITAVVTKYLKSHPEELSGSASDLVVRALREAFPKKH